MADKIGVALIGSGIFVKEEHLPAVQKSDDLELKAIYSRSLKSAKGVSEGLSDVALYSDDSEQSYSDLLKRDDVHAVIIALPIPYQPDFIKKALDAGKHVLAEKPLAKDVATGKELVKYYRDLAGSSKVTFGVAEQFRYLNSYLHASQEISKLGKVMGVQHRLHSTVNLGGKYIETPWRKVPDYQGGFLLDGGVHQIAALRLVLKGGGVKVKSVAAQTAQLREWLPPVDTVDAALKLDNGATGFLSMSFGSPFEDAELAVACEKGTVAVDRNGGVAVKKAGEKEGNTVTKNNEEGGVATEVWAWAKSIKSGSPDEQQSPEEGLADLEMLEALLKSGEKNGSPVELGLQI
ncbi:oxidoreductase-like protein family [Truncatella angustata]|uniref:Oxidoreductase-like protein family n=1 Tax=Truncatella angustata TaxID=152316 RepID=A0A9P8UTS1_9PEZI|nr:oxidoreductase-like protein family [Truncatella angustata]KAH6658059.1 oxidoreductase-like protein family [Truncatella angustata]